jgi:phosphohistidine phosphatase
MRRLILFRHAKADPREHGTKLDHERPLTKRGRADAKRIGRYLAQQGIAPSLALVSDSARTKEAFGRMISARYEPSMYRADPERLLALVQGAKDSAGTLLLVGHNPEFAAFAVDLAGVGEPDQLAQMRAKFPTAAVAILDFDVPHWADIGERQGRLERFVTPAMLGGEADD